MLDRREFLARCSAAGLTQTLLPGALLTLATRAAAGETATPAAMPPIASMPPITADMLEAAAAVVGLTLTADQRRMMLEGVRANRDGLAAIRDMHLLNAVAPAFVFDPRPPGFVMPAPRQLPTEGSYSAPLSLGKAGHEGELAYATVHQLRALLALKVITSVDLTKLCLARLRRFNPQLHCVITFLDDRALAQAAQADRELAAGHIRGPLHGIPWGAKDLLAVRGYPTTWGAAGFEDQHFEEDATVVQRLDAAGAVLVAKLSLGALAQGDLWFGGRTRNPWNPAQGSSGSSAGSACAVSAGCLPFALGSETLGSISSPSTRCGVTGFRPTFGLVPRTGAMALSWSMDKLGPIARCADDAALVLGVIAGPDGRDRSVVAAPLYPRPLQVSTLRIGYVESAFATPTQKPPAPDAAKPETEALSPAAREQQRLDRQHALERRVYDNRFDRAALEALRSMGVQLIPVTLPDLPFGSISPLLGVEAAAAFDDLLRSGRDALLNGQGPYDWPNQFRTARLYSGVDYVQAMRARSVLIEQMARLFATVDFIVTPSGGPQLVATNLSGHPACIIPNGLRGSDAPPPASTADGSPDNVGGPGTPVSVTFLGRLYDDARLLQFAQLYQQHTGHHRAHPPQFA